MIRNRWTSREAVRCDLCPGRPVLPTPNPEVNPARCIRCQGEYRWLPVPHPDDHLCDVCRRECPDCQAPSPRGGRCLTCQGICRTCRGPLPERGVTVRVRPPEERKDRKRRWEQHFFPHTSRRERCDACLEQSGSRDPLRAVLAAFPDRLLRACDGVPPQAIAAVRDELGRRTARQLTGRIERRWWGTWASRPLQRAADGKQEGYGPDEVAVWLLAPADCSAGCEDGFSPDNPDWPCPTCRGRTRPPGPSAPATEQDQDEERTRVPATARTAVEAVAYRPPMNECTGSGGTCGVPVAFPYTQCPACLNWPRCACGRRYDPDRGTACRTCAAYTV
ncbi:hypothetical protein K6I34_006451 [Streptomyces sp. UNOC14_S4]|nr:hypothetical protein [Streptomyces sp. UNOC14_S4]